ncbi:MAG: hypothetical protein GF331_22465 [Chitinivibrionales bacterium]|nr:hypothetical protein [Chitinivibrionales bacterium]
MRSWMALSIACTMVVTTASGQVDLLPGSADNRDGCWILRTFPGQTMTTYGIEGTGSPLEGTVTWNSFPGAGGTYHVELGAVLESDGNSPYRFSVDGVLKREGNYPYADGYLDCDGSTYEEVLLDLGNHDIQQGDMIQFWAQSVYPCGSSHGQYSRFNKLRFTPTTEPADTGTGGDPVTPPDTTTAGAWYERDGIIILEAEDTDSDLGEWVRYTNADNPYTFASGWAGDGYIFFTGNSNPGGPVNSELRYKLFINNPGTYRLHLRGMETGLEGAAGDETNDCYVKMTGQSTDDCEGVFTKWVLLGSPREWSWNTTLECGHHNFVKTNYELSAGVHEFWIAGRSKNFAIDRFIIHDVSLDPSAYYLFPSSQRIKEDGTLTDPLPMPDGDLTKVLAPLETTLVMGEAYTLNAEGENVSWAYDANSDGLGEVPIGTGNVVTFNVPTGITGPQTLTLFCRGDLGTVTKEYSLAPEGTVVGVRGHTRLTAITESTSKSVRRYTIDGRKVPCTPNSSASVTQARGVLVVRQGGRTRVVLRRE